MLITPQFDLNVNPAKDHQLGHNPDDDSRWQVVECKKLTHICRKSNIARRVLRTLVKDQHPNYMIIYSTHLKDGEQYDWHDWVKPSMWDLAGGWTDTLYEHYQHRAMDAFLVSESQITTHEIIHTENTGIHDNGHQDTTQPRKSDIA